MIINEIISSDPSEEDVPGPDPITRMQRITDWFLPRSNSTTKSEAQRLRERMGAAVLLCGSALGTLFSLIVLPFILPHGDLGFILLNGSVFLIWWIFLFSRNLKFKIRAGATLASVYLLGAVLIFRYGMISNGSMWLFGFAVLTSLFLGWKQAMFAVVLNFVTVLVLGLLVLDDVTGNGSVIFRSTENAALAMAAYMTLNIVTTITVGMLFKGLEAISIRERKALRRLRSERSDLVGINNRLKQEVKKRKKTGAELRESEARFRQLVELLPETVFEIDMEGRVEFINQAGNDMFGYNREEIDRGITIFDLMDEGERSRVKKILQARLYGSLKGGYEYSFYRKDGLRLEAKVYSAPIYKDGQARGFRGILIDITEQNKAKEALRWSEEKFSKAFQKSPVWVVLSSMKTGRFVEVNQAFLDSLGYTRQELIGRSTFDLNLWADPIQRQEIVKRIKIHGSVRNVEVEVCRKTGEKLTMLFSGDVVSIGEEDYLLSVSLDISERRKAEQDLLKSEKQYRDLFNSVTDMIYTHTLDGRLLSTNKAISDTLGYEPTELIGQAGSSFMKEKDRDLFASEYMKELLETGHFEGTTVLFNKKGRKVYIEFRSVVVRSEDEDTYVSGIGRDVTARILAEKDLRRLEEQLSQSQKMEAVGTLASGVAHEFNNMLQAISGFTQIMLLDAGNEVSNRNYLEQIGDVVDGAAELVRRLLTFGRRSDVELVILDLNEQVTRSVPLIKRTIPRMITVETHLDPDLGTIRADPIQIEQILVNMAINARDAMPDGGLLSIETATMKIETEADRNKYSLPPGGYAGLVVSDNGMGMDAGIKNRIFEPFFTTKEVGKGTGLGLSTVYGIVGKLNGSIICNSSLGEWTKFEILLPLAGNKKDGRSDSPKKERELPKPSTEHEMVLVVDDEPAILSSVREFLARSGYRVIVAENGEEALKIYRKNERRPDLVVLDLNMPGMSGRMVLRELLRLDPGVRVIIASGFLDQGEVGIMLDSGARDFIAKPYRMTELLKILRTVLDGPG